MGGNKCIVLPALITLIKPIHGFTMVLSLPWFIIIPIKPYYINQIDQILIITYQLWHYGIFPWLFPWFLAPANPISTVSGGLRSPPRTSPAPHAAGRRWSSDDWRRPDARGTPPRGAQRLWGNFGG